MNRQPSREETTRQWMERTGAGRFIGTMPIVTEETSPRQQEETWEEFHAELKQDGDGCIEFKRIQC